MNVNDDEDNFILFKVCKTGNLQIAKQFLSSKSKMTPIYLKKTDNYGHTPFILACCYENIEIVRLIMKLDGELNEQTNYGDTGFMWSCRNGTTEIIKLFLSNKKFNGYNTINREGNTPLIIACYHDKNDIVKLLLKKNININHINNDNETAFMVACRNNNIDIIKELLKQRDLYISFDMFDIILDDKMSLNTEIKKLVIAYRNNPFAIRNILFMFDVLNIYRDYVFFKDDYFYLTN